MNPRTLAFISVGIVGFLVQTMVLALLCVVTHWPAAVAAVLAVEAAILTNFFWHERWTWRDRAAAGGRLNRLLRFHITNGLTSLVGNTVVIVLLAAAFDVSPVLSNVVAVVLLSVVNYVAADRWVFVKRTAAAFAMLIVVVQPLPAAAAELTPAALAAWNKYVAASEASLPQHERDAPLAEPQGRTIDVEGGTIHEWRGSIVVRGVTVNQVVDGLLRPGIRQEDVAESRLLEQRGDSQRVYLKLVRRVIVTVTYDTEHQVQYIRRSPSFASSRSIATKIVETGGSDRGFLWKLNSYWTYRQVDNDVQIDLLSLSLSRDIPWAIRPIARPIINRIGRESLTRTLDTVRARATIGRT